MCVLVFVFHTTVHRNYFMRATGPATAAVAAAAHADANQKYDRITGSLPGRAVTTVCPSARAVHK